MQASFRIYASHEQSCKLQEESLMLSELASSAFSILSGFFLSLSYDYTPLIPKPPTILGLIHALVSHFTLGLPIMLFILLFLLSPGTSLAMEEFLNFS